MNKFHLPKLKRIEIKNYNLYNENLIINFSDKLNIIFGTNGTGKSTLMMIIIFSIIGPYKGNVKTKVRNNKRLDNRPIYKEKFFRDRMLDVTEEACVFLEFTIDEDIYFVKHSLYDCRLLEVSKNGKNLLGKIISYETYESKVTQLANRDFDSESKYLSEYLITKYHKEIKESTKLPGGVNTLISMLFDVMFFSESRKFTFWDKSLQEIVIGKYIVDEKFYNNYCEQKLITKSLESKYKKKSETYNYMRQFYKEKRLKTSKGINDSEDSFNKLADLEEKISSLENKLNSKQIEYKRLDNSIFEIVKTVEETKEKSIELGHVWYQNLFPNHYYTYYNKFYSKMISGECPICDEQHDFNIEIDKCIFCGEDLKIEKTINLVDLDLKRKEIDIVLSKKDSEETRVRHQMDTLRSDINLNRRELQRLIDEKNMIEINMPPSKKNTENEDLENAKRDRDFALDEHKKSKKKEKQMKKKIENNLINSFKEFSLTFEKYSKSFFGEDRDISISLPFSNDELVDQLMINFSLDGKDREEPETLSESQRIFTDLSFRFATLTNFHNLSFFLCETPDSTLDMYHEKNAVETFKRYINQGNSLIITANARKSRLISNLYSCYEEEEVNVIDLTKISRLSLGEIVDFKTYMEVNDETE